MDYFPVANDYLSVPRTIGTVPYCRNGLLDLAERMLFKRRVFSTKGENFLFYHLDSIMGMVIEC